jgi:hypothetical protein
MWPWQRGIVLIHAWSRIAGRLHQQRRGRFASNARINPRSAKQQQSYTAVFFWKSALAARRPRSAPSTICVPVWSKSRLTATGSLVGATRSKANAFDILGGAGCCWRFTESLVFAGRSAIRKQSPCGTHSHIHALGLRPPQSGSDIRCCRLIRMVGATASRSPKRIRKLI